MTGKVEAISSCDVLVDPPEVDVGAKMSLVGEVTCSPAADLVGQRLRIKDHTGALVEDVAFARFDGEANTTSSLTVRAPDEPGEYTWFAIPLADPDDAATGEDFYAGQATPFSFMAKAHATRLLVWDVPSSVEAEEPFTVTVGVKCSSGCDITGRSIEVVDENEQQQGTCTLTGEVWPGSEGLYYARLELAAPKSCDLHRWQVRATAHETAYPHDTARATLNVRTVPPADCSLTVEAVDREAGTPLPHASIVMHPYRAMTDENGAAELKVARGTYTIYVSCGGYYPAKRQIEVTEDQTTRAPLDVEPAPSKDR